VIDDPTEWKPAEDVAYAELKLLELGQLLDTALTFESFDRWKATLDPNIDVFSRIAVGSIQWRKSVGKLTSPTLASAFTIRLSHWDTVIEYTPGGYRLVDLEVPHSEPSKWDGPEDDSWYRVSFLAGGLRQGTEYDLRVTFSDQARWAYAGKYALVGTRVIEPAARSFVKAGATFIEPFEVIRRSPFLG
jgi:hypothetical protein